MDFKEEKIIIGDGHVAIHDWAPENPDGNHKNSTEIEHDINETRHTMDVLFDTLTNKLHPRTMVDHLLDRFQVPENRRKAQDSLLNTAKRINQSFQENPIPLMLIGAGIGLLFLERRGAQPKVSTEAPQHRIKETTEGLAQKASEKVSAVKESVSSGIEQAKESLRAGSEKVKESFHTGKERAAESIEKTKQAGQERLSQGREYGYSWQEQANRRYRETGGSVVDMIKDKPLAVGFAAAVFGLALGVLFPETRAERQVVGTPARETFLKAQEKEKEMMEQGKSVVEESAKTAYEKTKEKGITPESEIEKPQEKSTLKEQQPDVAPKKEVEKAVENKVSPEKEKIPLDLKEKTDEKISKKDINNKPLP